MITAEDLKQANATVYHVDGRNGEAWWYKEWPDYPRLRFARGRPSRYAPEVRSLTVDGWKVKNLTEAAERLNGPVLKPPPTPDELVAMELARLHAGPPPSMAVIAKEASREVEQRYKVYLPKVREERMTPKEAARLIWIMEVLHDQAAKAAARDAAATDLFGGINV